MVSLEFFEKIAIYWFLEGFGHLEILGPNGQKKIGTKKHAEKIILCCGFKKYAFVKNGAIYFRFRPVVHPIGAVRTEKFGPEKIRKTC